MPGKFSMRYKLSKKAVRELMQEVSSSLGNPPMNWEDVEEAKAEEYTVYFDSGMPCLARVNRALIPTLQCLLKRGFSWLPYVVVDRGATQALGRGADLMAPGIRRVSGSFKEGAIVAIVDEQSNVPVCVGRALKDSNTIDSMAKEKAKGKVIENVHYPGDGLWKLIS